MSTEVSQPGVDEFTIAKVAGGLPPRLSRMRDVTLAEKLGESVAVVRFALRELARRGWLHIVERDHDWLVSWQPAGPARVVTVRMPRHLHARLKRAAATSGRSLNWLCLEALEEIAARREAEHDLPPLEDGQGTAAAD